MPHEIQNSLILYHFYMQELKGQYIICVCVKGMREAIDKCHKTV